MQPLFGKVQLLATPRKSMATYALTSNISELARSRSRLADQTHVTLLVVPVGFAASVDTMDADVRTQLQSTVVATVDYFLPAGQLGSASPDDGER
jgi:hypothetical protein